MFILPIHTVPILVTLPTFPSLTPSSPFLVCPTCLYCLHLPFITLLRLLHCYLLFPPTYATLRCPSPARFAQGLRPSGCCVRIYAVVGFYGRFYAFPRLPHCRYCYATCHTLAQHTYTFTYPFCRATPTLLPLRCCSDLAIFHRSTDSAFAFVTFYSHITYTVTLLHCCLYVIPDIGHTYVYRAHTTLPVPIFLTVLCSV